jgi:hypothetical protein
MTESAISGCFEDCLTSSSRFGIQLRESRHEVDSLLARRVQRVFEAECAICSTQSMVAWIGLD